MNLQIGLWELVGALFAAFSLFTGIVGALIKWALSVYEKRLMEQLTGLGSQLMAQAAEIKRLDRDFMDFKASLPLQYVRREDFIRNQTVIEAKLDGLALRIENTQLRGNGNAH